MSKKKILSVTWLWYPTGGDWTYVENVNNLYEKNGYEVIPFSTVNPRNYATKYSSFFVENFDFKQEKIQRNLSNGIKALKASIVSKDAILKLNLLLDNHDIKVAHLHAVHHYITPAIITVLKSRGVKIIWTLHDYKILCPNSSFISNGKVCEKCINGAFLHCVINKCKKESLIYSAIAAAEAYYYKQRKVYDLVDTYLCPSLFLYNKFLNAGFDPSKLVLSHYCYDISLIDSFISNNPASSISNPYIIYIGRLEKVKGIETLIKAVKGTNIHIKIIGGGAAESELKSLISSSDSNIEFLGQLNKNDVFLYTLNSQFVICPSEWYENFPFSIIESFLFSKPVVGANIGGIPELVIDDKTGLLFEPGNVLQLREKLLSLWNNTLSIDIMGKNAREHAYKLVNFEDHWLKLSAVVNI